MSGTHEISRERCHTLRPFFDAYTELRVLIDSVLDGQMGRAFVDDPDRQRAAMLRVGEFAALSGEPAAASSLLDDLEIDDALVIPLGEQWQAAIVHLRGRGIQSVKFEMDTFNADGLSVQQLERLATGLPEGYAWHSLDARHALRCGPDLWPNRIAIFDSLDHFQRIGFGACALSGEDLVCAASSYAVSDTQVEIAMGTRRDHRQRGLAVPIAARCLLMALERGLEPSWNAANPASTRIALRLGFRQQTAKSRGYDLAALTT
jgi:hypothetical protein